MAESNNFKAETTNVVLTGSTGFLGKAVLREFRDRVEAGVLKRVNFFLPIRGDPRIGITGGDRCETLSKEHGFFYSHTKLCDLSNSQKDALPKICVQWLDPTLGADAWPRETNIVLLSAFDTKFERPLRHMLHSSVRPVVDALRTVAEDITKNQSKRWPNLDQIVLVSTAFVQPPLPYIRRGVQGERVGAWAPAKSWGNESVDKLYDRIVQLDDLSLDMAQKLTPNLPEQTLHNSYIFCKTLLEALIDSDPRLAVFSQSPDITLSLVRPSIIGASVDGQHYSLKSPGCSVRFLGHIQLVGRAAPWWGAVDLVPVCRVAKGIVIAAGIDNVNANDLDVNWADSGVVRDNKARIRYVTNGLSYSLVVLSKACGKWFVYCFPRNMMPLVQLFERILVTVLFCSFEYGAQLQMYYHLYERFASNQFDFPTVLGLNIPAILAESESDSSGKKGSATSSCDWVHVVFKEQLDAFTKENTDRIKKNKGRILLFSFLALFVSYLLRSLITTTSDAVEMRYVLDENVTTFFGNVNNSFMPIRY